jgi:hypothetical protein
MVQAQPLSSFAGNSVSEAFGVEETERALSNQTTSRFLSQILEHGCTSHLLASSPPRLLCSTPLTLTLSIPFPQSTSTLIPSRNRLSLFLVDLTFCDIFRRVRQGTLSPELLDETHLFLAGSPL